MFISDSAVKRASDVEVTTRAKIDRWEKINKEAVDSVKPYTDNRYHAYMMRKENALFFAQYDKIGDAIKVSPTEKASQDRYSQFMKEVQLHKEWLKERQKYG